MPTTEDSKPSWWRHAGLGFQFFGAVFGFVLLGTWIDRKFGTSPRGVLICATLGIVGGLYNLIRSALKSFPSSTSPAEDRAAEEDRE